MDPADLAFAGIARQAELIAAGEVSPRELVQTYLERIERLDPQLNAFRVVFAEQALAEAGDEEGRSGADPQRPLRGVPIAIKDDADVAGEVTAWGSNAYGGPAEQDSEVVRRLREAGAIVIGKTNVPELTIFPFTESETWGFTRNPWNPDHTTGGSSGGSAAAVASGMVGAALGSDGLGSIRIPAGWCGIFGIKPQRDRLSLAPKPDAWHGLSVYGPLTRSVRDAALFLDAAASERSTPSLVEATANPRGGLRIAVSYKSPPGVISKLFAEQRSAVEETAALLRSLGHTVTEAEISYGQVAPAMIARYLRGIHDDAKGMAHPERLEKRTRGMARMGSMVPARYVARTRAKEAKVAERLSRLLADNDAILTPGAARPAPPVGRYIGKSAFTTLNGVAAWVPYFGPWNFTGQPAVSVPAGFTDEGLPRGVQLVGRPHDEATLVSLAAHIEAERPWADRRPPIS
ncbi:MAG: amidase [Solirubrobacteraceae bacterium]|jgi:amidase|nr:amidase [Solirubrobacteraceae bacterium]